jgi:hypothetical protein
MNPYDMRDLQRDMAWVKTMLSNHLEHHKKYETALVIAILLMLIERLFC